MTARLAQFAKFTDRKARWDAILAPMLGFSPWTESKFSLAALDVLEARLLAAVYGDPEPDVPGAMPKGDAA